MGYGRNIDENQMKLNFVDLLPLFSLFVQKDVHVLVYCTEELKNFPVRHLSVVLFIVSIQ